MGRFVADPAAIARMGAAGRELALAEFDAETVAARILKDMGVPDSAEAGPEARG